MGSLVFIDLLYAFGIAISPTPVILVILMLFDERGRWNALGYLIGWMVGLIVLAIVAILLVTAGVSILSSDSQHVRPAVLVAAGLVLLWVAYRQWTKPLDPSANPAGPKWLETFDRLLARSSEHFTPLRAFVLGVIMSAISPKNIALVLAAAIAFTAQNLSPQDLAILFILFVLISSLAIGIPVGYALLKGDKADESLNKWKLWVIANSSRSIALLLGLLAIVMLVSGLSNLWTNLQA
ncbi:MAG: LysE family transporter [Anaerolineae bacterium]|nr:LysE family transporter [Anaerolineae bacterium]